ncbi:MAG: chemotaxis protein CheW [Bacteroidetes bacterium]|nr:chemotaxis protein CheW [Bacteroidota bacterium]
MLDNYYSEQTKLPIGFIVFNITGKTFCLDIDYILTIINSKELNQSQFFFNNRTSSIHFHDEVFPLIEFDVSDGSKFSLQDELRYIILISFKGNKIALFVDQIVDYVSITKSIVDSIKFYPAKKKSYLTGLLQYEDKNYLMLDLDQILEEMVKQHITFDTCRRN